MNFWRALAEQRIESAIRAGEFDDLCSAGRPLNLAENPFEGKRSIAHKLLKDAGMLPKWMRLDRELKEARVEARAELVRARRAEPTGGQRWQQAVQDFHAVAKAVNPRVHERNRLAPRSVPPLLPIRAERIVSRVVQRVRIERADSTGVGSSNSDCHPLN